MEAKIEKLEANVVKVEIKVEADKFDAAIKKAYNKNKMRYNIQGFRKGKVPMAIVKKFYGVEVFYDDAINFIIQETYPAVLEENDIKPVDYPKVDVKEIGEGKDFVYTAEITVFPEVKLGEYKGLEIEKKTYEVTEEDIQNQLVSMQEKNSRLEVKDGAIENGDIAVIDYEGFIDGEAFEGGTSQNYPLEIGSKSFIDNFEDQLVGLKAGDEKDVVVTFPEGYGKDELNGKEATFKVKVKEVKFKELPALDDEFAKEATEFETLADVKVDIKKRLEEANAEKEKVETEEAAITALIEATTIDLPQVMIEKEIDVMVKDLENRLKYQGLTLEQYMQYTNNTEDKMREYMKENAERKVRADLAISEVAKAENITASEEEVKAKAEEIAKMYAPNSEEDKLNSMVEMLMKAQRPMLENDIVIRKTIDLVVDNCKIK
ncbi:MAG: trigger factor [Clostridium sp.]|nr:trigger factor [Clostridium sp.]MDY3827739.1 trigger factor [Clostridium sp.]